MNQYEKQIAKLLLNHEQKVLNALESAYATSLADTKKTIKKLQTSIGTLETAGAEESLIQSKVYQLEYQQYIEQQISSNLNLLRQKNISNTTNFLEDMYTDSYTGNVFVLQQADKLPVYAPVSTQKLIKSVSKDTAGYKFSDRLYDDVESLKTTVQSEISRGIAQGDSYSDIAKRISDECDISFNNAYRIARTEGGRVSTEAQIDSINDSIEQGADLLKEWDATLDTRTRPVHAALDGQQVEADEYFQSDVGPVSAPHMFGYASQDINCRCRLKSVPRWAAKDTENKTKRNNMTGEILPYKDYKDFKNAYLKELSSNNK